MIVVANKKLLPRGSDPCPFLLYTRLRVNHVFVTPSFVHPRSTAPELARLITPTENTIKTQAEAEALKVTYAQDAPYAPPSPNSVEHDVRCNWHERREYDKFVEKNSRIFGEELDEYFFATEVVSQQHRDQEGDDVSGVWAKPAGKLGSGTFGTVNRLDVPTLGKSFAAKEANIAVRRLSIGPAGSPGLHPVHLYLRTPLWPLSMSAVYAQKLPCSLRREVLVHRNPIGSSP